MRYSRSRDHLCLPYSSSVYVDTAMLIPFAGIGPVARLCLATKRNRKFLSLRGAGSDEAISFSGRDCFTTLAMTCSQQFADALLAFRLCVYLVKQFFGDA